MKTWHENLKKYEPKIYKTLTKYINYNEEESFCWQMIECAYSTLSYWTIIQLQDILCLGAEARMNRPGTVEDNWVWRFSDEMITEDVVEKLRELVEKYKR